MKRIAHVIIDNIPGMVALGFSWGMASIFSDNDRTLFLQYLIVMLLIMITLRVYNTPKEIADLFEDEDTPQTPPIK